MKFFNRFIATFALTLSLAIGAFAGDIQSPGAGLQLPAPGDPCAPGDIQSPGTVTPDPVTSALLTLIQSVLPVL
jgi:hypothetical protein